MITAFALLILGPLPELLPMLRPVAPGLQNCPDGSVVASTATCPLQFSDHRFLLSHEPRRRELVERWWCGRSEKPNEVRVVVELRQPDAAHKNPYHVSRLVALSVDGQAPSAKLLKEVRAKVDGLSWVVRLSSRCQDTPTLGEVGVLHVNYWEDYEQQVVIELRP